MRQIEIPTKEILIIHDVADPWMKRGYEALNAYFGERGEMETFDVIRERFRWNPAIPNNGFSMFYEMFVIRDNENNIICAGDYSVILSHSEIKKGQAAIVHLSHIWKDPNHYKGAIKRLIELAIDAAHNTLHKASIPESTPIILAAEVELYEVGNEEKIRRLNCFLSAGLCFVDPVTIAYYQPDFRSATEIDSSGCSTPLPLTLMLKRINRESESETSAYEIKHIVNCLYQMYSHGIRKQDMAVAYAKLNNYPPSDTSVRLITSFDKLLTR